jgi:hypothetical protein
LSLLLDFAGSNPHFAALVPVRSGAQASPAGMDTQFFEAVAAKIPSLGWGAMACDV